MKLAYKTLKRTRLNVYTSAPEYEAYYKSIFSTRSNALKKTRHHLTFFSCYFIPFITISLTGRRNLSPQKTKMSVLVKVLNEREHPTELNSFLNYACMELIQSCNE